MNARALIPNLNKKTANTRASISFLISYAVPNPNRGGGGDRLNLEGLNQNQTTAADVVYVYVN